MNTKTRMTLTALIVVVLSMLVAPTAMAGETFNLLTGNNEFDTTNEHGFVFLDPWWTLANKSADKIACYSEIVAAYSGNCSFLFKGSKAEKATLKQKVTGADLEVLNAFADDAPVSIQLAYMVNSLSPKADMKAKVVVTLAGQTKKIKSVANFNGSTMIGEFTNWEAMHGTLGMIPQDAEVKKVAVSFVNHSKKGSKIFIDNVEVLFSSMGS